MSAPPGTARQCVETPDPQLSLSQNGEAVNTCVEYATAMTPWGPRGSDDGV